MFAPIPKSGSSGTNGTRKGLARPGKPPPVVYERGVHQHQRQQKNGVRKMRELLQVKVLREENDGSPHQKKRDDGSARLRVDGGDAGGQVPQLRHGQHHPRTRQNGCVRCGNHREKGADDDHHAADGPQKKTRRIPHRRFGIFRKIRGDDDKHHQRVENRHDGHGKKYRAGDRFDGVDDLSPAEAAIAEKPKKVMKTRPAVAPIAGMSALILPHSACVSTFPSPP